MTESADEAPLATDLTEDRGRPDGFTRVAFDAADDALYATVDSIDRRRSASPAPMKFGAIDVGTNSIHLVMAEISPRGDFKVLGADKDMVQLGRGGFTEHLLTPEAMDAGIGALKRFVKMAELKGVTKIKAVATSAVREAQNGGEFVDRVWRETGLDLRVITCEEEGRLIYLGVRHAMSLGLADNLIIDIGGGSVEFIIGNSRRASFIHSVKLGGSRLAELFIKSDPPTGHEIKQMRRQIQRELSPLYNFARALPATPHCIGTSGAIKSLSLICSHLHGTLEDDEAPNPRTSHDGIKQVLARMSSMSRAERLRVPGMDARRVDASIPACTLLHMVMKTLGIEEIEYCDFALREGVIIDYISSHRRKLRARAAWPNPRLRSVIQLAERCDYRREHAEQVARLAMRIFDDLQPLHGVDGRFKELLSHAALLHDVGYLISQRGHHKHGYYLIRNGELKGFDEQEIEIIANIARYHRKERPKKSHYSFRHLHPSLRRPVRKLSVLLRIANALDRTHYSVVRDVRCRIEGDDVFIDVLTEHDVELELYTTRRHEALFQRELGARLHLSVSSEADSPPPVIADVAAEPS